MLRTRSCGIKYITRSEIKAFNRSKDDPKGENERTSYWPSHRANASLKAMLCEDVDCETCEVKCGFGKEYLKRIETGKMLPRKRVVSL